MSSTEAYKRWEEFRNTELRKIIVQLEQENVELKNEIRKLRDDLESKRDYADQMEAKAKRVVAENAKLKKAAERYALQHMDEDELRIWATQQSEYIEELMELCKDMWQDIPKSESCGWDLDANCCTGHDECRGECYYWYRMRKLGIEVTDK